MSSLKNISPKHLSIEEMWKIHRIYSSKETTSFRDVANILYPNRKKTKSVEELLRIVIQGLYSIGYAEFVEFIKRFSNGN
jgi:hypothetical protein